MPGGAAIMVVVEPESAPLVLKPAPTLAVALVHEYEIAMDIPTSAILGWQDICAVGVVLAIGPPPGAPPGTHCQPVVHAPLCVGFHVPF